MWMRIRLLYAACHSTVTWSVNYHRAIVVWGRTPTNLSYGKNYFTLADRLASPCVSIYSYVNICMRKKTKKRKEKQEKSIYNISFYHFIILLYTLLFYKNMFLCFTVFNLCTAVLFVSLFLFLLGDLGIFHVSYVASKWDFLTLVFP